MTMLQRIADAVLTKAHNQERMPQVVPGGVNSSGIGGLSGGSQTAQMTTYSTVSSVFAAVSKIAEAVASVEWRLYRGPGTSNEVVQHDALTLWNSANPFETRQNFLETSQQHFELTGEMWWVIIRGASGKPAEIWAIRPDRMQPIKSHDEFLTGYVYTIGSEKIPIDREDVILTRHPNPLDPYRGMGPIQSLLLDLGSEVEAANFNRAFFRNDATPGGIIQAERSMSKPDFDRMVQRWQEFHQGTSNAGRIGFLEKATFQERKYTQRDMQYVQLRDRVRDQVLAAYGVPLPMLGVMEAPSRANAQASEYIFARWTIQPRLARIRESLNHKLLPLYRERGLHFEFADPTPNHRELDLEEATKGYDSGILTQDEARGLLGREPIDGGDSFKPAGAEPFMALSARKQYALGGITKQLTPIEIAERAMLLAWTRRLEAEREGLVAFLEENLGKQTSPIVLSVSSQLRTKIELTDVQGYNWDWWVKYGAEVTEELQAAIRIAMVNEFPQMAATADQLAATYAERRGARLLRIDGDLNLVNAVQNRVNTLVARTIENGESLQTLQANLRKDIAFSPERARVIARTETATAQGQGAKEAANQQDLNQKRWITQADELVSDECLANASEGWISIVDPFSSGVDTIPQHPNCRCNVRYRRFDPEEKGLSVVRAVDWLCPTCRKADTVVPNRDGPGLFCRRCAKVLV